MIKAVLSPSFSNADLRNVSMVQTSLATQVLLVGEYKYRLTTSS